MADTSTIASLATAGGTLVLAVATSSALAIPLRNVAAGLAVLHGWHVWTGGWTRAHRPRRSTALDRADPRDHETPKSAEGAPAA